MSRLYLVQHGIALPREQDPERGLSPAGRSEVEQVARWAAAVGLEVVAIRHSGKLRARQSAEILAAALSPPGGVTETSGFAPNDPVEAWAGIPADRSMLVGHLPFLARLAAQLVCGRPEPEVVAFRNAGIVCLGVDAGCWRLDWAVWPEHCARAPAGRVD